MWRLVLEVVAKFRTHKVHRLLDIHDSPRQLL